MMLLTILVFPCRSSFWLYLFGKALRNKMTLHMKYGDRRSDGDQERLPSPWQSLLASVFYPRIPLQGLLITCLTSVWYRGKDPTDLSKIQQISLVSDLHIYTRTNRRSSRVFLPTPWGVSLIPSFPNIRLEFNKTRRRGFRLELCSGFREILPIPS